MAVYVTASALSDPSLVITEEHAHAADVYVNAALHNHGIDPSEVTLPNALLTEIAGNWAKRQAAKDGALGTDSPLIAKSKEFEKDAERLAGLISRAALGIVTPPATSYGYGVVNLTRA